MTGTALRGARIWLAVGAILCCGLSTTASATFIGDEVRLQFLSVDTTFVVESGADPDFSTSSFNWNIESSSIIFFIGPIPNAQLGAGLSFIISDLNCIDSPSSIIVDATILSATALFAPATDAILTFDDHSITVDLSSFGGGSLDGVPSIRISLQTQVPEPSTWLLVGIGLVVMPIVRRRSARQR